ncbi:MAG TPA: RHS repeat-associated core domain-containing protein [Arachidicoccus soli]|nr:RHS repeat-associated core domain-containing protein [Arachidicoccus soli]
MPTFASITKKLLGCLKLTYHQEPDFRVIYSKKELTLKNSSQKAYRQYFYGFNGMEKDDEVSGAGNSYDFGARMYNPRVGRFLSIDPKTHQYPYFSPYCFAGNSPILFVDENGEGPILGFIKLMFFAQTRLAKLTGYTVSQSITAEVGAGMGPLASAGASASITMAADPKGNIAMILGTKVFYDLMSSETGIGHNSAAEEGNTALAGFAGINANFDFSDKDNVLEFGGNSSGSVGIDLDLGYIVSGSIEIGDDNVGIGIGIGIGAGFAVMGSENTVVASNYNDIEKFERLVKAPFKGIIFNINEAPLVNKGDALFNIGHLI